MKISVIIPTYKPSDYIWLCLDSLKNQILDCELFEIIIVLNGCKEPYESQICDYIANSLSGIKCKFIQTDLSGVSNARNVALDVAQGEYISFIDDDDYVSPPYLLELLNYSTPDVVALSDAIAFDERTSTIDQSYCIHEAFIAKKKCNILQVKKFFNGPCMKLVHRNMIGDRRFDTAYRNGEDSLFMFLISDRIKRCVFTSDQAIYYRRYRDNSAVTVKKTPYEIITNSCSLITQYTKIMLLHPFRYNSIFYVTRILAELHSWLIDVKYK